jgi:methyl-accepting chemotaxis protein
VRVPVAPRAVAAAAPVTRSRTPQVASATHLAAPSPARALASKLGRAFGVGSPTPAKTEQDWTEF